MKKIVFGILVMLVLLEGYLLRLRNVENIQLFNENAELKSEKDSHNYPFAPFCRLLACCSKKDSVSLRNFQSFFSYDTINLVCDASNSELSLLYHDRYKSSSYDKIVKIKGYDLFYFLFKDSVFVKAINPLFDDEEIDAEMVFSSLNETEFFFESNCCD